MPGDFEQVIAYHMRTKHQPRAMANSPARMDWANQPNPYRSYEGSPSIKLERRGFDGEFGVSSKSSLLDMEGLSRLFFESLALSAQKSFAGSKWHLRVNPSSGNLHPTEGYLIAGPVKGLEGSPGVYHYAPRDHALELMAGIGQESWQSLGLPERTVLIAFTSIYWRESWKYGERAFRYCMIDLGHALAAVTLAADCLGWAVALLDDVGTDDLGGLLGLKNSQTKAGLAGEDSSEREHPDALLAIFTDGRVHRIGGDFADAFPVNLQALPVIPNTLSPEHIPWLQIDLVSEAVKKSHTKNVYIGSSTPGLNPEPKFCRILRKRRSAQAMDGQTSMPRDSFHAILESTLPGRAPFGVIPWMPYVHPVLFVHRVEDMENGLYILLRDAAKKDSLQRAMLPDFIWEKPSRTPGHLELYQLEGGDGRLAAKESSCRQSIASDGCFAVAMIAEFEDPLQKYGPWFYSRLYWECGVIGQAFYLASLEAGFQGCGIGCFFDDAVHNMLGILDMKYQDLYHFTVGKALRDPRLIDLPVYD